MLAELESRVMSPFGGDARHVLSLSAEHVAAMYRHKCSADVLSHFNGEPLLHLYECPKTAYRFWRPEHLAGNEAFYHLLSQAWPNYYRTTRWEYPRAEEHLRAAQRVLEVGSGRGYFLQRLEPKVAAARGLELNRQAIVSKVTRWPIVAETIEQHAAAQAENYDVVCSFQVLEHVPDPASFVAGCLRCLKPGGLLILSTPNLSHVPLAERRDAFDLPPHHMGHFSPEVYRRLAALYDLSVLRISEEPRYASVEGVTDRTRKHPVYWVARRACAALLNGAYRLSREPGANVLAVLKKG